MACPSSERARPQRAWDDGTKWNFDTGADDADASDDEQEEAKLQQQVKAWLDAGALVKPWRPAGPNKPSVLLGAGGSAPSPPAGGMRAFFQEQYRASVL